MKRLNEMLCAALFLFALCAFGCKNSYDSSEPDEPPVSVQPGDNVVFSNQTEFAVKVYSDSLRNILIADLEAKGSVSCHVDVAYSGNVFYFSYFIDVNGVSVPYGVTDGYTVLLEDNSTMSVKITDPQVVNTNKKIILLKNEADSAIVLYQGNIEKNPEGKSAALVNGGNYGIYILNAQDVIETFTVVEGTKSAPLSAAADFESGYIYTIVYDGSKVYMRSKSFLDKNMNKKIWKISMSQEAGKTLINEKLLLRGNQSGYILYGRIGYDRNSADLEAVPYYAYIDSIGSITKENSFTFVDKPKCSAFIDAIEANDIRLALVEKTSSSGVLSYSVMSEDNGYSIHENIAQNDDAVSYRGFNIIHKKDNIFCVLLESSSINPDETYAFCRYELIEVTVEGYSSISTKKLCESDDSAFLSPVSFAYDSSTDTYIVMSQPVDEYGNNLRMTQFSLIDGTTGDVKKDLKLEKYLFNKVKFNPDDGYAYASGSFVNQITGKDVASFAKIDISTGTVIGGKPVLYPCQDSSLNSNFDDFVIDGDTIILGGYTNADYEMGENPGVHPSMTMCPYIVSYNAKEGNAIYERKYEDLKGFGILGINFSEIGSLLLDIFTYLTGEGYIVSTGLLGELPEGIKVTLPQSTSIKPMSVPDVAIEFHKDYSDYDIYDKGTFKYGVEITMSDLERYADALNGYSVAGWYDWDNVEDAEVSFPFIITKTMKLYPKFKISPPTGVYGYALSDSEICVQWDEHPIAKNYYLYWSDNYGNTYRTLVSNSTYYTISDLSPSSSYKISVIAYDSANEEWSDRSAECTVKTLFSSNEEYIPYYAEEMAPDSGNRFIYLYSGEARYYYAYFESGRTYQVWWADSYEGREYLEEWGYDDCIDVAVSVYYAGDEKGESIDSGYIDPHTISCSRTGYYLIEIRGWTDELQGWCAITCFEKIR